MAINDRYRRFVPHANNVEEIISADHVNELQRQVESNAEKLFQQQDTDFLTRALFVLEHHVEMNSLFVELFEDLSKLDMANSPGFEFSPEGRQIYLADDQTQGILTSLVYESPNSTQIQEAVFMFDASIPEGSSLTFEISNNKGVNWYSIPVTDNSFSIPTGGTSVMIRANFLRQLGRPSPVLNGYALLYQDPKYIIELDDTMPPIGDDGGVVKLIRHSELLDIGPDDHHPQMHAHDGLDGSGQIEHKNLLGIGPDDHHPKNHQHGQDGVDPVNLETDVVGTLPMESLSPYVFTGLPGQLELIRNPLAHDKLVHIIAPDEEAFLFYDWANEGRLAKVLTVRGDIAVEEITRYGTYTDSTGNIQTVLLGSDKTIKDARDQDVIDAIADVMKPAP